MKEIINNLRSKPEEVRKRILHISIAVLGIILVILWIISLGINFSNPDTQAKVNNGLKTFSVLKANLVEGYESMKESETGAAQ